MKYEHDTIVIDVPIDGLLELPVRARTTTVQDLPVIVTKAAHRIRQSIPIVRFEELITEAIEPILSEEHAVVVCRAHLNRKRL